MFAGVRADSGELYRMPEEGVIKVRNSQRRPEEERWDHEEFQSAKGVPWEPTPGAKGVEVQSHLRYRGEEEDVVKMLSTRETILRRIHIRKKMLVKNGTRV